MPFWYDKWLSTGPITVHMDRIQQPTIRLHECWDDEGWNEDKLLELVGPSKTAKILLNRMKQKPGRDMFIWKPALNGCFSLKSAWEVTRVKTSQHRWMSSCIWQARLPKKVSCCMWKILFNYLPTDDRVRCLGIPLASSFNCCSAYKEETIDHIFSMGVAACLVWKKAAMVMSIYNEEIEPGRVKLSCWYGGARDSTSIGVMIGLILVIITWRLAS